MSTLLVPAGAGSHLFWFSLGVCTVAACHITYRQLDTFKKRCEIKPPPARDAVDKTTEDAIRLDTLAVLARGINYNLSRAALRIIAGRALTAENFSVLLLQLQHPGHRTRLCALKTLKFLLFSKTKSDHFYENDGDYILSKSNEQRVAVTPAIKAVMLGLYIAVTPPLGAGPEWKKDDECERYGLECLWKLFTMNTMGALQAGIVDLLKKYPTEGYPNVVVAINDSEFQPENYQLCEIYAQLLQVDEAQPLLQDAGLDVETIEKLLNKTGEKSTGDIERELEELDFLCEALEREEQRSNNLGLEDRRPLITLAV